jgi:membrane dipeptidase
VKIFDTHTDYTLSLYKKGNEFGSQLQINEKLLHKGGVAAIFCGFSYDDYFGDSQLQWKIILREFSNSKKWQIIKKGKSLKSAISSNSNKKSVLLHLEGAKILNNNLKLLIKLYKEGLRSLGLTHNNANSLATGCKGDKSAPLTLFGKKVIKTCNKKGVVVDLSHINKNGFYQAIETSEKPVIVSHANCYKLCPNPRNLTDKQIQTLAKGHGTVGVFFSAPYVKPHPKKATINDVIDHIKHIAYLVGTEHITIGSDFGGITSGLVKGLKNASKLPDLITKLNEAGFSKTDVENISHKNIERLLLQILPN